MKKKKIINRKKVNNSKNARNSKKVCNLKSTFVEKCKRVFDIIKDYFKMNNKRPMMLVIGVVILFVLIISISFSFANLTPQRSVEIFSEKLNYQANEEGAWKVTKSSYWTDEGTAKIDFRINSILKPIKRKVDVVLVLDTSASMVDDRLNQVKSGTKTLISSLLGLDENNKIALIAFNTTSTILSDFTRDNTTLETQIDSMVAEGSTNYYQALNSVDEVLSDYVVEDGRDCVVVFLTDGYPTEETPNEKGKASELKSKYPYIKINSISYEMGDTSNSSLKSISDTITVAESLDVKDAFYNSSIGLTPYGSFVIEDTINSEYFDIIKTSEAVGEVEITEEDGNSKVVWDLGKKYHSGTSTSLSIEIKLRDEYLNTAGVFQTNIQEIITSTIGDVDENVTSSLTPVIADNYMVTYDGNAPDDCTVDGIPETKNHSVFTTVGISDSVPTCSGYKFKGWKVTGENITKLGSDHFIMPEANVTVKAEWANIKLKKSMAGDISEIKPLYDMMASNSVADNIPSQYVTSSTGINFSRASSDTNGKGIYMMASTANDEYPIYYYRGAVENNNVKFADFCWKMVRTTDTGGVKLIYNGLPDSSGGCTKTASDSVDIGETKFNDNMYSLADVGYMFGVKYPVTYKKITWYDLVDKKSIYKSGMTSTNFYYGDSVSYDYDEATGKYQYTLTDTNQYLWSSNYSSIQGKYSCLSETETSCESVKYIEDPRSSYMYYVEMSGGETYNSIIENLNETKWVYGNDVEYKDIDGDGTKEYVLVDTYESALGKWSDEYTTIASKYHYSCFSEDNMCDQVYYFNYIDSKSPSYIVLNDGKKVNDVFKEMISETTNENDSLMKAYIDNWYKENLVNFTEQLEDTIWCNDRSVSSFGGWDKDRSATGSIAFYTYLRRKQPKLSCNLNDSFTVEPVYKNGVQVGNGKLTYRVALLTADEMVLAGAGGSVDESFYLYGQKSEPYSLLTPLDMSSQARVVVFVNGHINTNYVVTNETKPRPAISLKKGTKATSGDGSAANPYVIGKYYSITVTGNDDIQPSSPEMIAGKTVTLSSKSGRYSVVSFKLNGERVIGNSFVMPEENVEITEIEVIEEIVFESEHNPYPNSMKDGTVYGEKIFEGATSLTVTLEYQTESTSYDWIYLYDSASSTTPVNNKKYGGKTLTTETITINSNYIKIVFRTDVSGNNYYGFKATIVPNYD